jgi:hypothetical protein
VDRIREIRKKLAEEVVEKMGEMGEERCQSKRTAIYKVRSPRQSTQGKVNHAKVRPGKRSVNKVIKTNREKELNIKTLEAYF